MQVQFAPPNRQRCTIILRTFDYILYECAASEGTYTCQFFFIRIYVHAISYVFHIQVNLLNFI